MDLLTCPKISIWTVEDWDLFAICVWGAKYCYMNRKLRRYQIITYTCQVSKVQEFWVWSVFFLRTFEWIISQQWQSYAKEYLQLVPGTGWNIVHALTATPCLATAAGLSLLRASIVSSHFQVDLCWKCPCKTDFSSQWKQLTRGFELPQLCQNGLEPPPPPDSLFL